MSPASLLWEKEEFGLPDWPPLCVRLFKNGFIFFLPAADVNADNVFHLLNHKVITAETCGSTFFG